jgi:hypothetical protein
MKYPSFFSALALAWCVTADAGEPRHIVEAYPPRVQASIEAYQQQLETAAAGNQSIAPFYVLVPRLQRWKPGATVRVAFNGGDESLYLKIRDAASEWVGPDAANLKLAFTDAAGHYLHWTPQDQVYSAEIRISFDQAAELRGFWSHVGTNSINAGIVGGAPGEASMNLQDFDQGLPGNWDAVVKHEFGHALGFHHEHQSPVGGCDFRFQDDPGYVPTKDEDGWFTTDVNGRRPGLYTYLGGKANYWPRSTVDANLGALPNGSAFLVSDFDRQSIMKYFFDAFMFVNGEQSHCYTPRENTALSALDIRGARLIYPRDAPAVNAINKERVAILNGVDASPRATPQLRALIRNRMKTEAL